MRRTIWTIGLLLTVLLAALPASAEPTTITFGIPWPVDIFDSVFPRLVAAYENQNPDVKVEIESGWNIDKQMTAAVSQTTPDLLANLDQVDNPLVYQTTVFRPLESMLQRHDIPLDVFLPDSLSYVDESIYGIKLFIDPNWPLFYNKTLMAEHGVDPKNPPRTIAELDSIFPKLTKWTDDGSIERIAMTPWTGGNKGFMFVWGQAFGAKQWEGDQKKGRFNFLTPEWQAMARWHQEYLERYAPHLPDGAARGFGQQLTRFISGQQVMGHSVVGHWKQVNEQSTYDWALAGPLTTPAGAKSPMWFGGFRFGIGKHAQKVEAAFDFLRFITYSSEASVIVAEHGLFPAYRDAAGLSVLMERDPRWLPVIEAISVAAGTPFVPPVANWNSAVTIFRNELAEGVPYTIALENLQRTLEAAAREAGY